MKQDKLTIEEWRTAKGVTKEWLADACKVSVQTIKNWEKDPGSMTLKKACLVCKALDVDIVQLDIDG